MRDACPACGTRFGYSDARYSHTQLRRRWEARGRTWQFSDVPKPLDWNPEEVVRNVRTSVYIGDRAYTLPFRSHEAYYIMYGHYALVIDALGNELMAVRTARTAKEMADLLNSIYFK